MKDICFKCGKIRKGHWALLFSHPMEPNYVCKLHICPDCYFKILSVKWGKKK
jgi:hypothetical protein